MSADQANQIAVAVGADYPVDEDALRAAIADANLPTLLLALAQLSGERRWLEDPYRPTMPRGLDDHDSAGLDDDRQAEVREAALRALIEWRAGRLEPGPELAPGEIAERLAISLSEPVDPAYGELLAEEMGAIPRHGKPALPPQPKQLNALVIGAGMSGICAAIKLKASGIAFSLVDKNDGFGGTWLENEYPGCGVDTPSHLYSFSFARRADWQGYFAERAQLADYFEDLAAEHSLDQNARFGLEVTSARWDGDQARWEVELRNRAGRLESVRPRILISAVGHFNRPSIPPIAGLDEFPGPCMHTARWDSSVDLTAKRVAVIGSGASAMQVVPALAGVAAELVVVQRSRQWAIPHPNVGRRVSPGVQRLLADYPFYGAWYRLRQFWRFGDRLHPALQLDRGYQDPDYAVNAVNASHRRFLTKYIAAELEGRDDLIELSVPDYPAYGKRPLIDHGWYSAIRRADVELLEGSVGAVEGNRIVLADGRRREVDAIVLATGFKTLEILGPIEVVGRSGQSLRERWGPDDARAFLGMTVPDFPNFFILFGPNTSTGHGGSAFLSTEFQVRYLTELLAEMSNHKIRCVECRPEAFDDYNVEIDQALSRTVWTHPRVDNYYRNAAGRIVGTSPLSYLDYWKRTRHPQLSDFIIESEEPPLDER